MGVHRGLSTRVLRVADDKELTLYKSIGDSLWLQNEVCRSINREISTSLSLRQKEMRSSEKKLWHMRVPHKLRAVRYNAQVILLTGMPADIRTQTHVVCHSL